MGGDRKVTEMRDRIGTLTGCSFSPSVRSPPFFCFCSRWIPCWRHPPVSCCPLCPCCPWCPSRGASCSWWGRARRPSCPPLPDFPIPSPSPPPPSLLTTRSSSSPCRCLRSLSSSSSHQLCFPSAINRSREVTDVALILFWSRRKYCSVFVVVGRWLFLKEHLLLLFSSHPVFYVVSLFKFHWIILPWSVAKVFPPRRLTIDWQRTSGPTITTSATAGETGCCCISPVFPLLLLLRGVAQIVNVLNVHVNVLIADRASTDSRPFRPNITFWQPGVTISRQSTVVVFGQVLPSYFRFFLQLIRTHLLWTNQAICSCCFWWGFTLLFWTCCTVGFILIVLTGCCKDVIWSGQPSHWRGLNTDCLINSDTRPTTPCLQNDPPNISYQVILQCKHAPNQLEQPAQMQSWPLKNGHQNCSS